MLSPDLRPDLNSVISGPFYPAANHIRLIFVYYTRGSLTSKLKSSVIASTPTQAEHGWDTRL
jgi:hypothetical protein